MYACASVLVCGYMIVICKIVSGIRVGMADKEQAKSLEVKRRRQITGLYKDRRILIIFGLILVAVLLFFIFLSLTSDQRQRSESYKDISGAAGLNATIKYDCQENCEQKYSFNVYIFNKDGQQINVVWPNSEGRVQLALPEGDYVMLLGKRLSQDSEVFPQEPLALKNGKELELELNY